MASKPASKQEQYDAAVVERAQKMASVEGLIDEALNLIGEVVRTDKSLDTGMVLAKLAEASFWIARAQGKS